MKKLLLMMMASFTVFACSVDEDVALEEGALKKSNLTYSDDCTGLAGEDSSIKIEYSDAESLESWDAVRNLYVSLLDPEVNTNGTFEPTIWEIIDKFHEQGLGDLTTTYSVSNGDCSDSALLTVTVVPDGQGEAACEVSAGSDNSFTITESEANSLASWDEVRNLYLSILSPEAPTNGSFNPTISEVINSYTGVGEYMTTYTVGEGDCTDSAILTLIVIPDDPACEANAGPDTSFTITESEANSLESWDAVRNLYLAALSPEVQTNGTFNPTISDIINSYTGVGEYTTTYTVGEGDCTDSAILTLVVVPDGQGGQECEGVTAGPDNSRTILESEAAAIGSWDEVRKMYLKLLAPGVAHNGTFDPSIWDIIHDFQARRSGNFTTTYTVSNGECSDSVELTVTVIPD